MMERDWSSPFGGRGVSAALIAAEKGLRARQRKLREKAGEDGGPGGNAGGVADKWQLLRALTQARAAFGLGDRTLAVLHALLSFHPGKGLEASLPQIVFPSNRELSLRALGMAPATLRRHLAALVEAGLILRRDSPNGKRYRRTEMPAEASGPAEAGGEGGRGDEAFGFDLSPLALLSPRIFAEQEMAERQAREERRLRGSITLVRRDAAKVLEAAFAEGRPGPFERLYADLAGLQPPRRSAGTTNAALATLLDALVRLCAEAENLYLASLSEEELSASDARSERHLLNSNTDPFEPNGQENPIPEPLRIEGKRGVASHGAETRLAPERKGFDLATVLRACPDIADYASGPIHSLADLIRAAETVRSTLGISPSAYEEAREVMGPAVAAVVVAAILQRAERIHSAGGYLRRLSEKAREGRFSLGPMLRALT